MSSGALSVRESSSSPANNPVILVGVLLVAVMFALTVTAYNVMGLVLLVGLMVFVLFVRAPELGVYITTALLLLQGSAGVLGVYNENSPFAVTTAQIAGVAAMGAWFVGWALRHQQFRWTPTMTYLAIFALWALLGSILSPNAPDLLPHWARMAFRLFFLILSVNVLNTAPKLNRYLHVLLVCAILTSLVSVMQYLLPSMQLRGMNWASATAAGAYIDPESLQGEAAVRVSGQAGHSNWLAMTLILLLPINAFWYQTTHRRWAKLLIVACAILQVSALVLTFARTGFIIGLAVLGMLIAGRLLKISPMRVFIFLLAGVIGFSLLPDAYKQRVLSPRQYVQSQSVQARLALQGAAVRYAVDHPVFGMGTGGFGMRFVKEGSETATQMRYIVEYQNWQAVFIGTHNMFLQILADTGVMGFVFYIGFYYLMFRNLTGARKHYLATGDKTGYTIATSLLISLTAFLLCAIFLHALHQAIWWMIAAAAMAIPMHKLDFHVIPIVEEEDEHDLPPAPLLEHPHAEPEAAV